jgi:hypothetical protein
MAASIGRVDRGLEMDAFFLDRPRLAKEQGGKGAESASSLLPLPSPIIIVAIGFAPGKLSK